MPNDKWRFHQYCSELSIRVPKAISLNNKTEIDFDYLRVTVGLPFVLKPTNKCNSLGVRVICSKERLHKEILSNRKYYFSPSLPSRSFQGSI
jgi:carbamoylphosphate synthase large subunit